MKTIALLFSLCFFVDSKRSSGLTGVTRLNLNDQRWRRQDSCAARAGGNSSAPTQISNEICCDGRLNTLLQNANLRTEEKLGDAAKKLQRRIQKLLGHSYEVIVSRGDFVLSSHYHGDRVCKLQNGDFHVIAYETPVPYNHNDLEQENRLAAVDAEEELGSTIPKTGRGRFPNVKYDVTAGENLALQPTPDTARAALRGGGKYGNQTSFRQGTDVDHIEGLPAGTTCDHSQPGGNKCCSGALFSVMDDAFRELSTSPSFGGKNTEGVAANLIKKRVQEKYQRAFEVFVSKADFALSTHQNGDYICKYESHGYTMLSYETPQNTRYDIHNITQEESLSSVSDKDPLGTSEKSLPGQRSTRQTLELEKDGERKGFPMGSQCGDSRLGSPCCSLPLFNAMHSTMVKMLSSVDFNRYNMRRMAGELKNASEDAIDHSVETIVSTDDFVVSSYSDDVMCKFRIEEYYVMSWKTPVEYPVRQEIYADNGFTSLVDCMGEYTQLQGSSCCSGELRYEMIRAMDESNNNQIRWRNSDNVARAIVRAVQRKFRSRFEAIVSRGDFSWNTPGHSEDIYTCKVDLVDFHALVFRSSLIVPSELEFLTGDVVAADVPQIAIQNIQPFSFIGQPPQPFIQNFVPQQFVPQQFVPQQFIAQQFAPPQQSFVVQQAVPQQQIIYQQQSFAAQPAYYASPAAAGGGGGGACFSEDTWVTTPSGKKNMAQLELGDYVLTANATTPYFAQVTVWMHREPEREAEFTTIMTDYGKMLRLTPKHLIFRNICDDDYEEYIDSVPESGEEVFAHEVKRGDCLILLYKGKWRQQKVKEITVTKRKGIYAPLTSNGRIIVNDILASCYSDVKGATLQTSYFELMSFFRQRYNDLMGIFMGSKIDLPFSIDLAREMMSLIIPIKEQF